ncbi:uncharacterized protein LOC116342417 [Contarinia nasturtii]|uniref:uncharacterized protein LOC116342417 n=1 Tax=Contarinia nasturtii TaxID=265458 RepID=UPI0012D3ADAA|nr:uncharacterized protein LOC116342417 [Contarinia nasturtii]
MVSLKSRALVTYRQYTLTTRQTFIRCSEFWFKNRTRKQFMEAVLYEMLDLYLTLRAEEEISDNLNIYLLEAATTYLNRCFGTNLAINNNNSKQKNVDESDVERILESVANDRKMSTKKARMEGLKVTPEIRVLSKKLKGNSREFKCVKKCGVACYCPPQMKFREHFFGANIYAIYTVEENKVKCILCQEEMPKGTMDTHLDNNCPIFRPF